MIDYEFADGTALVTGAASGIGEALAHGLAARGSHLVLLDRSEDRLSAVAAAVRRQHPALRVDTVIADLGDHEATIALGRRLASEHPELTLVINNAGRGPGRVLHRPHSGGVRLADGDQLPRRPHPDACAGPRPAAAPGIPSGQPLQRLRAHRPARADRVRHQQVRRARSDRVAAGRAARARRRHLRPPGRHRDPDRRRRAGQRRRRSGPRSSAACRRSPLCCGSPPRSPPRASSTAYAVVDLGCSSV